MVYLRRAALEFMLGVARELHPREFVGLLRGVRDTVDEVIVVPASIYGGGFAQVRWMHVPLDRSIIGSVHSHPSSNNSPSSTDLRYFSKTGDTHFIIRHPYRGAEDIACYSRDGERLGLEIID